MRDEDIPVGILAEVVDRVGEWDLGEFLQAMVGLDGEDTDPAHGRAGDVEEVVDAGEEEAVREADAAGDFFAGWGCGGRAVPDAGAAEEDGGFEL